MSRTSSLTTTSYAVLGLLAVKPWSTYELTRQMDRSLNRIWPRAASKIYEEPKKLVGLRLARAHVETNGKRPRTVYTITPRGRRALAGWLEEPGTGISLESEALLQVFFAENGSSSDTQATLASLRAWAAERNEGNLQAANAYANGTAPFQSRAAQTVLVGTFLTRFYALVAEWAEWAQQQVASWPDDPRQAQPDPAAFIDLLRTAGWSEP